MDEGEYEYDNGTSIISRRHRIHRLIYDGQRHRPLFVEMAVASTMTTTVPF